MRSNLSVLTLLTVATVTMTTLAAASAGEHGHGKFDGKGHHRRAWCPHCGEACYPTVTKGKETKHCFDTEVKPICIPKVRFPWEAGAKCKGKDGCVAPKCGRTKHVNVLLKHEYECTVCKYSWDPSGFKGDAKREPKLLDSPGAYDAPAASPDEVTVPPPPAVEAQRLRSTGNVQPVSLERIPAANIAEPSPQARSRVKFFPRFFK